MSTTHKEALKAARELIQRFIDCDGISSSDYLDVRDKIDEALSTKCVAQPANYKQEPAAWMCHPFGDDECEFSDHQECENCIPLYTTPPQRTRVGLTDADYVNACMSYRHDFGLMTQEQRDKLIFQAREWARAFGMNEAAHGIKGDA